MKYAIIAFIIVCWTALAFLYRLGARKDAPRNWVAVSAAVVWLGLVALATLVKSADVVSVPRGLYIAGALGGVSLVAAFPLFMGAVARGNLAVSWTALTLSFAAAALLGIGYPGEHVTVAGVMGLVVAAGAIALLGWDSVASGAKGGFKRGWGLFMALAFAANTLAMYVYTLARAWGGIEAFPNKMAFFIAQTAVFLVGSSILCASLPSRGNKRTAIAVGAALGVVQFAGNYGVMLAMGDLNIPGYVFFPATTGGSTLTVALVSALVVGERPGRWGWLGLALGLAAMVLLGGSA
jgi:hypothetical protein